MNPLRLLVYTFLLLSFVGNKSLAQERLFHEGSISLQVLYADTTIFDKYSEVQLPTSLEVLVKGDQAVLGLGGSSISSRTFSNVTNRTSSTYLQFYDQKFCLEQNIDSLIQNAYLANPYRLVPSTETKSIEGFSCQKVTLKFQNSKIPDAIVYYTNQLPFIPTPLTLGLGKIKGFIMEVHENLKGVALQMRVIKMSPRALGNEAFTPPTGFRKVTLQQLFVSMGNIYGTS